MMVRWGSWDGRTDRQMDCVGFKKKGQKKKQTGYKQTDGLCKNRKRSRQIDGVSYKQTDGQTKKQIE